MGLETKVCYITSFSSFNRFCREIQGREAEERQKTNVNIQISTASGRWPQCSPLKHAQRDTQRRQVVEFHGLVGRQHIEAD